MISLTEWRVRAARLVQTNPIAARYAVDGLLVASAVNIVANNNNLFATRLGAGDYQLSLIQFLPQAVNLLILIPGGLATDALRNKRPMVTAMMLLSAFFYTVIGFTSLLPLPFDTLYLFIAALSLATGSITLFSLSWQAYFPEVVAVEHRNQVLTLRTQVSVFVGIVAPLLTGAVLSFIASSGGKVIAHQGFYILSGLLMFVAVFNFRRFEASAPATANHLSFPELKKAFGHLLRNKSFLGFTGTVLFFYFTWQMDWTLYYIGQVQYLHMNEFMLGLAVVGATGMQFATLRFWSRRNDKYGVVLPVTFGILGLALCPLSMIAATCLPAFIAPYAFILFNTLANTCFATIVLNMFQCLLQVVGENRGLSISVYTTLTCFSNAVMPVAGVALYRALGGTLSALQKTFWIVFVLRIMAAGLWVLRMKYAKKAADAATAADESEPLI